MSNFELIDDYLSNRLKGAEKEAFEKQLNNDPSLKSDLDFQRQVVEGIRTSRAAELKNMLSKVPVGGTSVSMDFSVVKMAASIIGAGVVGAVIYFYVTRGELPPFDKAATDLNNSTEKVEQQVPEQPDVTKVAADSTEEKTIAPVVTPESKESKKESPKTQDVKPVEKPKIEVTDPSSELESSDNTKSENPTANISRTDIRPSHIQVDVDSSNKKFDFHYQFVGGKLMLYGSFDKSLYEVLEINGDKHSVFLYYKDSYYLLSENQHKITKLEPITDSALIGKLKEYRR